MIQTTSSHIVATRKVYVTTLALVAKISRARCSPETKLKAHSRDRWRFYRTTTLCCRYTEGACKDDDPWECRRFQPRYIVALHFLSSDLSQRHYFGNNQVSVILLIKRLTETWLFPINIVSVYREPPYPSRYGRTVLRNDNDDLRTINGYHHQYRCDTSIVSDNSSERSARSAKCTRTLFELVNVPIASSPINGGQEIRQDQDTRSNQLAIPREPDTPRAAKVRRDQMHDVYIAIASFIVSSDFNDHLWFDYARHLVAIQFLGNFFLALVLYNMSVSSKNLLANVVCRAFMSTENSRLSPKIVSDVFPKSNRRTDLKKIVGIRFDPCRLTTPTTPSPRDHFFITHTVTSTNCQMSQDSVKSFLGSWWNLHCNCFASLSHYGNYIFVTECLQLLDRYVCDDQSE